MFLMAKTKVFLSLCNIPVIIIILNFGNLAEETMKFLLAKKGKIFCSRMFCV